MAVKALEKQRSIANLATTGIKAWAILVIRDPSFESK